MVARAPGTRPRRPALLLGPSSRLTLDADRLHPAAAEALAGTGLAAEIGVNPYRSIVARAVELSTRSPRRSRSSTRMRRRTGRAPWEPRRAPPPGRPKRHVG